MKNLILVTLFIFPLFLASQNYIPIPCDSTAEWRVNSVGPVPSNQNCLNISDYRYFFKGDTVINSKNYSKL